MEDKEVRGGKYDVKNPEENMEFTGLDMASGAACNYVYQEPGDLAQNFNLEELLDGGLNPADAWRLARTITDEEYAGYLEGFENLSFMGLEIEPMVKAVENQYELAKKEEELQKRRAEALGKIEPPGVASDKKKGEPKEDSYLLLRGLP